MIKKLALSLLFFPLFSNAQEDLLAEVADTTATQEVVTSAYKSLKIVNLESTKLASKKDLYLIISHRFGFINEGIEDFFGLDNANTRIQFVYGLSDKINIQASRDKFRKTYEAGIKYKLVSQKTNGFPFEIVGFNSISANTELDKKEFPKVKFNDRLSYVNQVLISRKFTDRLSLELAPTFLHENFVYVNEQDNSQFLMGVGGRYKISKRVSINADYAAHLNRANTSTFKNPLSVGCDVETGGHVFQLFFSNSRALVDSGFLGSTNGNWEKGQIAFGFNLTRTF